MKLQDLKFSILDERAEISYRFIGRPNEHTEISFFNKKDPIRSPIHRMVLKTPYPIMPGVVKDEYHEFFYFDIKPMLNISGAFGNDLQKVYIFNQGELTDHPCKSYGLFKCHLIFLNEEMSKVWNFM